MATRGLLTLTATLMILAAAAGAVRAPDTRASGSCDRVASPAGSDSASGAADAPFRTAARLVDALSAGETGCLRAGFFGHHDQIKITTPGITIISYPGERAKIVGRMWVAKGADGVTVSNLDLDGRNDRELPSPTVNAHDTVWRGNAVTNGHDGGSCFNLGHNTWGHANRTLIEENRIYDCGELPATNQDHGIYAARTVGTVIRNNWIHSNADRGIQLYPNADGAVVTQNVIDGNGQGIILGGDEDSASDDNIIERNIVTNSKIRYNVEDHWPGPTGTGNLVRGNCVWTSRSTYRGSPDGSGIESGASGFTSRGNVVAKPGYTDPLAGDFTLASASECSDALGDVSLPDGDRPSDDQPVGSAPPDDSSTDRDTARPPRGGKGARKVRLRTSRRTIDAGSRLVLRGRIKPARAARYARKRLVIQTWEDGRWQRFAARRVGDRRFTVRRRVLAPAGRVHFRAWVKPFGRSRPVRVTIAG